MLIALAPNAFAQVDALDVTYRDFPANHPGFDEFDQDKGNSGFCAEETYDPPNGSSPGGRSTATPDDLICVLNGNYVPCSRGGTKLIYGAENSPNQYDCAGKRGYTNGLDPNMSITGNGCWANGKGQPVAVTRGMVRSTLDYSQCTNDGWIGEPSDPQYMRGRYCARPVPGNNRCYGSNLQNWFTNGGSAKAIKDELVLDLVPGTNNTYEINHDYNNVSKDWSEKGWGADRGFFPLDKYSDDLNITYGRQNVSLWCGTNYPDGNCPPRNLTNPTELETYARNKGMLNKLHNYGFTMAGSLEFKYNESAEDMFKFIGDDDMWIFIDGVLFEDLETGAHADLGGIHLPAPAAIDIQKYGRQKSWRNGTSHVINFFYVERQTDGSNLMLQMSLSDLSLGDLNPSRFGPNSAECENL
jgi:fibro-slime domain-containing protein